MIDRLFTAALAFTVLVGGTFAIGSELWAPASAPQAQTAQSPQ